MNKIIYITLLTLVLLVPGSALATSTTTSSFDKTTVFVVDGVSGFVRDLNLKATQAENGDVIPVSDFEIVPEDVIQVKQGGNLLVFTGSVEDVVEKVKVTPVAGITTTTTTTTTELVNVGGNSYSVQVLVAGVYTLDVIVDIGDEKAAFETILVVLGPNQSPVDPLIIINNFQSIVKTKTVIKFNGDDDDDDDDDDKNDDLRMICAFNPADERCPKGPNCPPGWGNNEADQCFPSGPCPDGSHRANDDESGRCVPEDDLQQCEDGSWAHKDEDCPEDGIIPLPPGNDTRPEPPVIPGPGPEPEPCTPDGPPCPPCPEGVEAGWCADEDERQDFDCGDPDMENDPRCENGEPVTGTETPIEESGSEEVEEEEEKSEEGVSEEEESGSIDEEVGVSEE